MKCILLNAPPGAGKDTLGAMLGLPVRSFKEPLFRITRDMLGEARYALFLGAYQDRPRKEAERMPFLGGRTPREWMQHLSEDIVKPEFGAAWVGTLLAESIVEDCVFTDGGFAEEVQALRDAGHHVVLVRLHRDGYTFRGDTRSYLYGVADEEYDVTLRDGMVEEDALCLCSLI